MKYVYKSMEITEASCPPQTLLKWHEALVKKVQPRFLSAYLIFLFSVWSWNCYANPRGQENLIKISEMSALFI